MLSEALLGKLIQAAEQGDAEAPRLIANAYMTGDGVPQNFQEAAKWYRKAAELGNAEAQYFLGFMYDNGEGVEENMKEAVKWYRKAAKQGHEEAQSILKAIQDHGLLELERLIRQGGR